MKKLLFILIITSTGFAFTAFRAGKPTDGTQQIKFKHTLHDFGDIPKNVPATFEFVFTNTGLADLKIDDAQASCGCTKPIFPEKAIKPGKKGTIKVTYNAAAPGAFLKTVTVTYNGSPNNQQVLTISGNVVEKPVETIPATPNN